MIETCQNLPADVDDDTAATGRTRGKWPREVGEQTTRGVPRRGYYQAILAQGEIGEALVTTSRPHRSGSCTTDRIAAERRCTGHLGGGRLGRTSRPQMVWKILVQAHEKLAHERLDEASAARDLARGRHGQSMDCGRDLCWRPRTMMCSY